MRKGQGVDTPPDRGSLGKRGIISNIGTEVHTNINGVRYVWVTVNLDRHKEVWPSHRLGFNIKEK
jgi:hypothetical protein